MDVIVGCFLRNVTSGEYLCLYWPTDIHGRFLNEIFHGQRKVVKILKENGEILNNQGGPSTILAL